MKKPLTLENIFIKEPVRSILNLMIEFAGKKEGLKPLHFRFALEKNYPPSDIINKDTELEHNIRLMKNFFENRLDDLYNRMYIEKSCINSKEHLNYYLRILGKDHLNVIEKNGEGKKSRYKFRADFYREGIRLQNNFVLGSFSQDKIKKFTMRSDQTNEENKDEISNHVIYGLSEKMYKKFTHSDKKIIEKNLFDIEKKIMEIEEIKMKILWVEIKRRLKNFYYSSKSNNIKIVLKEKSFEFFVMFIDAYKDQKYSSTPRDRFWIDFFWLFRISGDEAIKAIGYKHMKDSCKGFSEKYFDKDYELSWDDIKEMIEWGWKNIDLYDFVFPMSIAFSRYCGYGNYFKNYIKSSFNSF